MFKTKTDANGNIEKFKARLVVKRCAQQKGIDYAETFSPVVLFYYSIPHCDGSKIRHGRMCLLKKSLYGLKQSSRAWNSKLGDALIRSGLKCSRVDACVYYRVHKDHIIIVAIYVVD